MAAPLPATPKNTWLGKLIVGVRACRALLTKPSPLITFTSSGDKLTGERSALFDATPDQVWNAIFHSVIMLPPHRSMADVREGDTVSFYQDMTAGRGLYWSKIVLDCQTADIPRYFEFRLRSVEDDASARIGAIGNTYILEPTSGGTRLTSRVVDEKAGEAGIYKSFMSFSITADIDRITRVLDPGRPPVPPAAAPRSSPATRTPTIRRAYGR